MIRLAVLALAVLCASAAPATDYGMPYGRGAIALNGTWQVVIEHGGEEMWKPEVAAAQKWADVQVPGPLVSGADPALREATKFVWARKTFWLDPNQAAGGQALRWGGIRFGATAWLNGQQICDHTAVGPNTVMIPKGIAKEGQNVLLLKVPGWAGVAKSKSGYPLMPVGGSTQSWGAKNPGVTFDVWMELYDTVYIKRVLAMPDVKGSKVTLRVWIDGVGERPAKLEAKAAVSTYPDLRMLDSGIVPVKAGDSFVDIAIAIPDARLWSLEERNRYFAGVVLEWGRTRYDQVNLTFGMRELKVENGHFTLNGKPFYFRGSNLVNEWHWGAWWNDNTKLYIVDAAHAANLNCFRTHTGPPPHSWLNVADEHGTFFLAELPILYNYANFVFTTEEKAVFHANALKDAEGWVTELWNHPSVAMWVLSNESPGDNKWETGPLQELVNALDPTRPTMRTGVPSGTKDMVDIHTCGNVSRGSEGGWMATFAREAAKKDPARALTNSEYMNRFGDSTPHWLGRANHPYAQLNYAEFCMEHTEAMRRVGFDCVLPYMYSGWTALSRGGTPWRADYVTPMAASLHSCMAPVIASLDLYDRNYVAGAEVTTKVALINELLREAPVQLDLYVTPVDPLMVPDADALKAAVWHKNWNAEMNAASRGEMSVTWKVPAKEGNYWLAMVTTREGDRPVVSQRVIRAVGPSPKVESLKGRKVVLFGGTKTLESWTVARGIMDKTAAFMDKKAPFRDNADADVVIVADDAQLASEVKSAAPKILDWVRAGGRLVILDPPRWAWTELVDYRPVRVTSSRALPYANVSHWLLTGIDAEWMKRPNGVPSVIADRAISGLKLEGARNILWTEAEDKPVVASIPMGKGEIVICLLKLKDRVSPESKDFDPAAERLMVNLLAP